ncbi:hypothetical protein [Microbulbifer sp. SAOS-129_SWC]|uniref:hypothetical protein n=1 Tax=Microbulbifer sp. SAOS-129_SWC TaxID=3145235 RepID=UPI0032174312
MAEFIMRGRVRAVLITLVGIPLISPAALALVSLRRGSGDGLMVLAWALLPVVVMGFTGHMSPLMIGLTASPLVAVCAGALVLRSSRSWSAALLALAAAGAGGILLTDHFSGGLLQTLLEAAEQAGGQVEQMQQVFSSEPLATGYLTWFSVMYAGLALALARHWQALLYNPGGFREEFHQLRMPLPLAGVGMLVWVYCLVNPDYVFWGGVVAFPLVVAGIALVHWLVASRNWGRGPLVAMYVALVIATLPLAGFLCGLALIDSWIDIRRRAAK